jgi:hypothetical protein
MEKTLQLVSFDKIVSKWDIYTNMLSHVHINPQDNPVMLTSPKRRYISLAI